ncbi:uncharacterized protein AMSG_02305 [Thecamonas trahens ATCC 50062]|uniref:DUF2867 domain-containing protein n=1 Tax=Thecamonas trahens ATCC 50062 TaxID=461836 RepID=A0A0L0DVT6_THETB|nr:hypothetical protein AMSG_02305 [Thecamonas trahens ATCC 50062]KNC56335.1 hypothetical protein AMSG_02305 [Thecamonas trahens ATCC 50062]|eukprot:XP_013760852.1 hypothetical protein AMSG_02305 [Thecamonas trahens ATCC 50062]
MKSRQMAVPVASFPAVSIPVPGSVPVEVTLIAQLAPGSGSHVFDAVARRQAEHAEYVAELDEPSAKLGNVDLDVGDRSSLYTFTVDGGHPFHRHAGHRVVVGIAGASGSTLAFSTATDVDELRANPTAFVDNFEVVRLPPDALFTLRFDGSVWHRFSPDFVRLPGQSHELINVLSARQGPHPAFTAISTHTDETGGDLAPELAQAVCRGEANIAMLTELLPDEVVDYLAAHPIRSPKTTALSLEPYGQLQSEACYAFRSTAGRMWRALPKWEPKHWVLTTVRADRSGAHLPVTYSPDPAPHSMLRTVVAEFDHQDEFAVEFEAGTAGLTSADVLALALEGFLENPPDVVSTMMRVRNALVAPLRLRTSPLGCPVSSLLSRSDTLFAGRFPVHDSVVADDGMSAEVLLGADDKHVSFRSVVRVEALPSASNTFRLILGNRVECLNVFGKAYMWAIDASHRNIVAPGLIRHAAQYVIAATSAADRAKTRGHPNSQR